MTDFFTIILVHGCRLNVKFNKITLLNVRLDSSHVVEKEKNTNIVSIQRAEYLLSEFPFCLPAMKRFK